MSADTPERRIRRRLRGQPPRAFSAVSARDVLAVAAKVAAPAPELVALLGAARDAIKWSPHADEVRVHLRNSDLTVMLSRAEGAAPEGPR